MCSALVISPDRCILQMDTVTMDTPTETEQKNKSINDSDSAGQNAVSGQRSVALRMEYGVSPRCQGGLCVH